MSADTVLKLVRRFGAVGVIVASVLALAAGELNYAHATYDDAFIFFRYAANLAGGHGLLTSRTCVASVIINSTSTTYSGRKPDYVLMLALPHGKDGKPESPFTYAQQLWQDPRFGEQYRILQEFRSFISYERFKDPT